MESFWNAGASEFTMGLDPLGVRQVDQAIERRWASNITTISFRARYLTLLTWLVSEYWSRRASSATASAQSEVDWDVDALMLYLARLEFIAVAATLLDDEQEGADTTRLIGSDIYANELGALRTSGSVSLPETGGSSSTLLNTYFMPCKGFGLLTETADRNAVLATERGHQLRAIRAAAVKNCPLVQQIFDGGVVTREAIQEAAPHFSMNRLSQATGECEALVEAMTVPYSDSPAVQGSYSRYMQSTSWAFANLRTQPTSSAELIQRAFGAAAGLRSHASDSVEHAYASFEFYRRVHHALEVLLMSVSQELQNGCNTCEEVIEIWRADTTALAPRVINIAQWPTRPFEVPVRDLPALLRPGFLTNRLTPAQCNSLPARTCALYATAMIACDINQVRTLQMLGRWSTVTGVALRVMDAVKRFEDAPLSDLVTRLLEDIVIEIHLSTTLRKMRTGKCSLRMYREGGRLIATGIGVNAGYSADRLSNVLNMWADIGALARGPGQFSVTERGRALQTSAGQ